MEVVLRAAVGTTSVNGVTTNTEETPNREPVMDWLHTLEQEPMLDAVNDILALLAMSVLDRDRSRTVCIDFMDNPFHGIPENDNEIRRMAAQDGTTQCHRYCTAFVIAQGKPLTLAVEPVDGEDSMADAGEHSLVLDHLLLESGNAVWVNAHGHGTTQSLARIAPSLRLLKRIAIARAFMPWQHYSLLQALSNECTTETNLLVLPAVDYFYRSEDCSDREGERLFTAGCSLITGLTITADVSIVLTRTADDDFTAPLMERVNTIIQCELTTFGPRFAGEDFETLVYPLADGTFQTTLTYWQRVLSARHLTLTSTTSEVSTYGAN